jgi:hypothetical protein
VSAATPDFTPEQRRRNAVLGLLLAALVLVLMVTWMIIFSRHGLPQDPQEAKRLHAQGQAEQASPAATPTAPTDPAAEHPAR